MRAGLHRRNGISKETITRKSKMSGNGRKFVEEEFSWGGFEDNGSNIVLSPEEDLGLHETPHISG